MVEPLVRGGEATNNPLRHAAIVSGMAAVRCRLTAASLTTSSSAPMPMVSTPSCREQLSPHLSLARCRMVSASARLTGMVLMSRSVWISTLVSSSYHFLSAAFISSVICLGSMSKSPPPLGLVFGPRAAEEYQKGGICQL